jgi:hypothetical protein
MNRTIYKYPIDITEHQHIPIKMELGTTAKIIHVGLDPNGTPCIWVELIPGEISVELCIHIVGTGRLAPNKCTHKGSFVMDLFVWHVYS